MRVPEAIAIAAWSAAGGPPFEDPSARAGIPAVRVMLDGDEPGPWVDRLRRLASPGRFGVRLPAPGDPAGLRLPPGDQALAEGPVIVRRALDPRSEHRALAWTAVPGSQDLVVLREHRLTSLSAAPTPAEAGRALREAMREATADLRRIDAGSGREAVDAVLTNQRSPRLPVAADARALRLLDEALRILAAVDLARRGTAGPRPASASGARQVGAALRDVSVAARRAVEAGVEHAFAPPLA